jgi:hypothetical protein
VPSLNTELEVVWRVPRKAPDRTDEDTIELLRRLAAHHPDTLIAGVLACSTAKAEEPLGVESSTADRISSLRTHWKIFCDRAPATPVDGKRHAKLSITHNFPVKNEEFLRIRCTNLDSCGG